MQFENNQGDSSGGAILYYHQPDQKAGLVISRTSFINNKAETGGAISFYKSTPKAATLPCTGCTFDSNDAEYGSAVWIKRNDYDYQKDKPGAILTVSITSSVFNGARADWARSGR